MAGWLTSEMQKVAPITQNGTTTSIVALTNNGTVVTEGAAPPFTQVPSGALLPIDAPAGAGAQPITVAASAFDIAAIAAELIVNSAGTSTAGAATMNTTAGVITTEALTTAPGATYTFTLTNSLISASSPIPRISLRDATNSAGQTQINSITNGAGSVVAVFQNIGTAAFNGKKALAFHV